MTCHNNPKTVVVHMHAVVFVTAASTTAATFVIRSGRFFRRRFRMNPAQRL